MERYKVTDSHASGVRWWNGIPATLTVVLLMAPVAAIAAVAGGAAQVSQTLQTALDRGYLDGDVAGAVTLLASLISASADDADLLAWHSRALLSIGETEAAMVQAEKAIARDALSANAAFALSQAMLAASQPRAALDVAREAIGDPATHYGAGMRGALVYSATAMLIGRGDLVAAERNLLAADASLADLFLMPQPASVADIGGPWHGIQALAAIYREAGREDDARRLSARLTPLTETFFLEQDEGSLTGPMRWNLAATGLGRVDDEVVLGHLEAAVESGFLLDWRYNYAQHPALWPLHGDVRFDALLRRIALEMSRQRTALGGREP